ncbi:heterogeneous nuclear ribonucleoprotein 1-like [Populus nigra]|uniref:heterogeneous nuclear ribonucleoprotein 1-like n=1 Tax=Populus nigra TaxID=3691 RepID=UPI002B26FBDE|nr:heterogeneous nuclear ribonucleoprotein 1-like [Populus nigra]
MNDRKTGQPRGFGFVTYSDPSAVDQVVQDTHIINGKQVEIKRTIPKGAAGSKDFKTKKIIMSSRNCLLSERLQNIRSCGTTPPIVLVGSGFITFDTEKAVDDLLAKGFKLELAGIQKFISGSQTLFLKKGCNH